MDMDQETAQRTNVDASSNETSLIRPSSNVNKVKSLLFHRMLVGVSDGRFFMGLFHCLDKQGNIILQDAVEYRSTRRSSHSPMEQRGLGLILIPATCRTSCHVDCAIDEQMSLLSLQKSQRTGRQFVDEVLSLACWLAELGVQPGDVVAISALNSDLYLEWLLAVTYVGGIVAPLNYRWSLEEYRYALANVSPVMLVADETLHIDDSLLEVVPSIKWHAFIGNSPAHTKGKIVIKSEDVKRQAPFSYTWAPEGAAIICFTSGTSGRPKGAVLSHDALIVQSMAKIAIVGYSPDDVYLHTASLCHIGGISSALAMLMAGARHIITPKFEAEKALKLIEDYKVTSFITVPAMLSDLIAAIRLNKTFDLRKSVKKILNGGGSLQGELIKDASKYFSMAKLQSAYGMTEGSSSLTFMTVYDPAEATTNLFLENVNGVDINGGQLRGVGTCVGKPAPHVELKICAEDESSHVGKILTRGPHLMLRYCGSCSPSITTDHDKGFWHDTGDIGYLDAQGSLWLLGRSSGKIKSGGENVYPEEVEAVLLQHVGIGSVVVIGVPDGRLGEMVVACVRLRQNWLWDDKNVTNPSNEAPGMVLTQNSLRRFCKDKKLTGFKVPKYFFCWKKPFPVTATGKVIRGQVRKEIVAFYQVSTHSSL